MPKISHTLNKSATLRSRPGRRIFSRFCRDLDEVSAAQGVLRPAANPGRRIFSRFCRDLDEVSAAECAQCPSANPGRRISGRFCRNLDEVSAAQGVLRPAANPCRRIFSRFCRDLDEVGAAECAQLPSANPGRRIFGRLCRDLDCQTAVNLFKRTIREPTGNKGCDSLLLLVCQLGIRPTRQYLLVYKPAYLHIFRKLFHASLVFIRL